MCGIVGYVGGANAVPILMDGLRRLEYRGYDSAGVAVIHDGRLEVRRSVGKITALERLLAREPLEGRLGVAHTRWATHGRPSDQNAHPHRDCSKSVAVVHNGIIENHAHLRKALERDGHTFESQTDTEVIAHLIERYAGEGVESAARRAAAMLHGAYALGIISAQAPGKLLGVKNGGAPLVVAVGPDGLFLASDIAAVVRYTRDVVVLDDGEMAVLSGEGVKVVGLDGHPVHKAVTTVPWDTEAAGKDGYPHFMLKEIHEQPRALEATRRALGDLDGTLGLDREALRRIDRVAMVACGTSWHAALVGKYMVETLCRIPAEVDLASEYRYRVPLDNRSTLTVAISQSGETADTLGALRHAKDRGSKSVAICNVVGSSASREADGVLYTRVGPEIGVASTKSFTGQLVALYLFAVHLGRTTGALSTDQASGLLGELTEIPHLAKTVLARGGRVAELAAALTPYASLLYLGRGITYQVDHLSGGARGGAQAQGAGVHPRGRLSRGRDEARADRSRRPEAAGGRAGPARSSLREGAREPRRGQGSERPRGRARERRGRRHHDASGSRALRPGDVRAPDADRLVDSAAAPGVPHRRAPGL